MYYDQSENCGGFIKQLHNDIMLGNLEQIWGKLNIKEAYDEKSRVEDVIGLID